MLKSFIHHIVYHILNLLHPILVPIVIKIMSWEPPKQKPNPIRARVAKKLAVPKTIQEIAPPIKITDLKPSLDYKQVLKEREEAGNPIKPVRHRKPISKDITCPNCGAPYTYIYSNATVDLPDGRGRVQKHKCKICDHQWFPVKHRKHITLFCPYCGYYGCINSI